MNNRQEMSSWSVFVRSLLLLLVTASFGAFISDATPEGDALFTMMGKWGVAPVGWHSGGDPCTDVPSWEFVVCRDGSVVKLNMTGSGISGGFPSEIGDLRNLEVLDLSNLEDSPLNSLSGPFPDSLVNCVNLKSFNGSRLNWDIDFPVVITQLPNLEEFYLSSGQINGSIPDEFYKLSNLKSLFIGSNNLRGSLKSMADFKNLVHLAVSQSDFTGTLPDELSTLTNLQYLNCHTCNLYGPLPDSFSRLQNLQNLTLHRNNLTGPFPTSWKDLKSMRNFRIDQNYLSGDFPSWMFDEWPDLDYLYVTKNRLSGPTPNMTDLDLKHNLGDFNILKWECNYMNGFQPCSASNPCSEKIESKSNHSGSDFDFDKNCYDDASTSERNKVLTDCLPYHPNSIDCTRFYQLLAEGSCLDCPTGQKLYRGTLGESCACELVNEGSNDDGGVSVGGVVGIAMGIVVLALLVIGLILYKRRKHFSFFDIFNVKDTRDDGEWEVPPGVQRFSVQELGKITQDFHDDNMIGQGGFGKVFMGTLDDGRMVAIKRATAGGLQGTTEFRNEVGLLSRLHHRNLVRLEGFCDDGGFQILVYEFMTKGNLHAHLLGKITSTPLNWYRRLEIAYGVAQGLEYLHSFADPPVIHRDVKPSNILLDDHMVAKLADFGISKVSPEYDTHVSTRPAGTAGYLDPDYFMRRQLTSASDVYAYGVVLLELVTGQEAIDHSRLEEFNLIEWVKKRFRTSGIVAIIDPLIEHDYAVESYNVLTKLGLQCASFDRMDRPSMKVVLSTLEPLMVMQNLYPDEKVLKNPKREVHITFDTEYLSDKKLMGHTSQSNTNVSDVGSNIELMSHHDVGPR